MHFGKLKKLKAFLDDKFDHTLLINKDDPLLPKFIDLELLGACKLVILDNVGMEGTSDFLWDWVNTWLKEEEKGRVCCYKVEVREHEKNSAFYEGEPIWFKAEEYFGNL